MIVISETIEVPSSPGKVWEVISDPGDVVSCIGGAEIGSRHDDGSFDATLAVRFGGLRVSFAVRATLELSDAEREGRLAARGQDRQGATRVSGDATFRVREADNGCGSVITVDGEIRLSGKLASIIDAGAAVVVKRMSREFAESLAARCMPGEVPARGAQPDRLSPIGAGPVAGFGWLKSVRRRLVGLLWPIRHIGAAHQRQASGPDRVALRSGRR